MSQADREITHGIHYIPLALSCLHQD